MSKIKVAMIGSGLIAKEKHIPALLGMKRNVELVAVCDKNVELARKTAAEFGIAKIYGDASDMFSKEKLDLVDVCVPPQVHSEVAIESIQNGCHVMMEKPMALTTSDCDQMIGAARKHRRKLCVIHNDLFHPPFVKAKRLVNDGAIGDFIGMRIFLSTPRWDMIDLEKHWYHKLPGGVIGETGPHVAYMALAFLKSVRKADVHAYSYLNHPWAPFDEFKIELEGEKGTCSATLSYARNCWEATVDIVGTDATLEIDLQRLLVTKRRLVELRPIPIARDAIGTVTQMVTGISSNALRTMLGKQKIGTCVVIDEFVRSLQTDSSPPVTGEEGRDTVRVVEMIVQRLQQKYGKGLNST